MSRFRRFLLVEGDSGLATHGADNPSDAPENGLGWRAVWDLASTSLRTSLTALTTTVTSQPAPDDVITLLDVTSSSAGFDDFVAEAMKAATMTVLYG